MTKRKIISTLFVAFCVTLFFVQCKKKSDNDTIIGMAFDKSIMLSNIGENIIIPAYADLKNAVDSLNYFNGLFTANPSLAGLSSLQTSFLKAYFCFQRVSAFEFGPADKELIRVNFNSFPCDTTQVKSKIAAGDFDVSTIADLDVKGFPAVDFLLYGIDHNNDNVLALYTSDTYAVNRKKYISTLINELKTKTALVYNAWSPKGENYIKTFINSTTMDVGSSIGLMVNQLNYDFEVIKNYKIGIPLGKKTQGSPLPAKVEAFYSQKSVMLAIEHIKAIENLYLGRSSKGVDGLGLDDYLAFIKAQYNGALLSDAIKAQLTKAISKLQQVPDPLSQTIIANPSIVDAAFVELQKQVVLFKTDMPSALGVLITYQDNDGD